MQSIDTGSQVRATTPPSPPLTLSTVQVCNLAWSKHASELVSTHGYSQNQILVWKYPSLTQVAKLTGHSYRVLYLAMSPDGESIVTGAGDETLRFWNVFRLVLASLQTSRSHILTIFQQSSESEGIQVCFESFHQYPLGDQPWFRKIKQFSEILLRNVPVR